MTDDDDALTGAESCPDCGKTLEVKLESTLSSADGPVRFRLTVVSCPCGYQPDNWATPDV